MIASTIGKYLIVTAPQITYLYKIDDKKFMGYLSGSASVIEMHSKYRK